MSKEAHQVSSVRPPAQKQPSELMCGLVMPISALDGCSPMHWEEVKLIITDAVESIEIPSFKVKIVSDADDVGVIQKRIVQNIYSADIIVCDVSGKNPNVMFELGMRLAFDKPTIIIKDDKTDYSFDTGIIEHITYPRDLRFSKIVEFKKTLADKVAKTYKISLESPDHSTFLKNFGKFQVASLSETELPADKLILESLSDIQREIGILRRRSMPLNKSSYNSSTSDTPMSRIVSAIIDYQNEKKLFDLSDVSKSQEFREYIIGKCNAPVIYPDPEDFMRDLDFVVNSIQKSSSQKA